MVIFYMVRSTCDYSVVIYDLKIINSFIKVFFFIIFKKIENITSNYIAALGLYRFFYILNWFFFFFFFTFFIIFFIYKN